MNRKIYFVLGLGLLVLSGSLRAQDWLKFPVITNEEDRYKPQTVTSPDGEYTLTRTKLTPEEIVALEPKGDPGREVIITSNCDWQYKQSKKHLDFIEELQELEDAWKNKNHAAKADE